LGELRERTRDLEESLEYQTATSEVLTVISRSTFNLQPVLETVLEMAVRLCRAQSSEIFRLEDGGYRMAGSHALVPEYEEIESRKLIRPGRGTIVGRTAMEGKIVHVLDALTDPLYEQKDQALRGHYRTMLGVPLMRNETVIGVIALSRPNVEPFSTREIDLLRTFADQAVIAIENTRLITETREALEQQTATAEVLGVINSSPGDLAPVFDTMLEKATRLCDAAFGVMTTYDDERFHNAALHGLPSDLVEFMTRDPPQPGPQSAIGRILRGEDIVQIEDMTAYRGYQSGEPRLRAMVELGGARSYIAVSLRKDGQLLGTIAAYRQEVRPFTDKQIALLQNFAAQAVIAMENARLLTETRQARDAAETALRDLQAAQANLLVAQKMASLGQLTAGIAHEIKNPLNFVNNFAGLSVELLDELKETTAPTIATLDEHKRTEIEETIETLTGNLEKISEHGRRADNIVKSMLEHSRGVSGERRKVDLNALIEEALNLAYHGARAQDASFNITMERDVDPDLPRVELAPQEMTRVFLNLFGNGFYAATKRQRDGAGPNFRPTLKVTTRDLGNAVEVRVRDNGTGISPEIRDKLFQPFFTTKPTGEGTGLGLSISYDIVTQQHGGTIQVDSEPGAFTEFTICLPRYR
jgi:signal transduction histidine kinase